MKRAISISLAAGVLVPGLALAGGAASGKTPGEQEPI
jgi:hypothetical protein